MADALTGLSEVSGTIEQLIAARAQEVLTASAIIPGSVLDYSNLAQPGMDRIKIPRFTNFTVDTKSENTALDAQINAFSTDDLLLDQYKAVQYLIEDIAELQSKVNAVAEYNDQIAKDLAAEMDLSLINALESGTSAAAPDHRVAYAGASLAKEDVLEGKKLLDVQNCPQADRYMVVSPASFKALLNISEFVKVNEAGESAALRNGQIGMLFGFTVLMSSQVEDAKTLVYHKSAMAFARQMLPKVESQRKIEHLGDRWSVSHIYGRKVLSSGKRVVMLGTAA